MQSQSYSNPLLNRHPKAPSSRSSKPTPTQSKSGVEPPHSISNKPPQHSSECAPHLRGAFKHPRIALPIYHTQGLEIFRDWKMMLVMHPLEEIIRTNCPPLAPIPTDMEPKLNKLGSVKAVLFDVYGTLFVSGSGDVGTATATDTAEALTEALMASGFEGDLEQAGQIGKDLLKTEIMEWHKAGHAAGIDFPEVEIYTIWKKVIRSLFNTDADPDEIRRLAVEYECRVNPVFPMPESIETINQIQKSGHVLGLVSNAQFYTPLLFSTFFGKTVEECGFDPDCCIWSFEELEAKPSEALFLKVGEVLREKHSIELSETVYVGNDMLNDIYCAKQAGCKTVLFAGDQRSLRLRENDDRCLAIQPDAVITSLDQLLENL